MCFYRMLVQVTWVGVILSVVMAAAAAATEYHVALPGCPEKCGHVTIPYPFGMTEDCHLNDSARGFFVSCKNNLTGPLMIGTRNLEVTKISIEGEINILMFIDLDCYGDSAKKRDRAGADLRVHSFTVSVDKNKFVAVGCDTYAVLMGNLNSSIFSTGCLSRCENIQAVDDGHCYGIGCCKMEIPGGLKHIMFKAYSFNQYINVRHFSPCSYAFIIQDDIFKFSKDNLTSLRKTKKLPMVLDWAVGNENCEAAQNKENYLCGANSRCIELNPNSGPGYRCNCNKGYEGNPYLKDGCQGIQLIYISTIIFQKIIIINTFSSTKSSHIYYIYIYIYMWQYVTFSFQ